MVTILRLIPVIGLSVIVFIVIAVIEPYAVSMGLLPGRSGIITSVAIIAYLLGLGAGWVANKLEPRVKQCK
ncbi:MAG: hypothetical protein WA151_10805 [Desulfatirhabdiaceae bacterium]